MNKMIGFLLALGLFFSVLTQAAEYRGLVGKVSLEAGSIQVDNREHRIGAEYTRVFYQDRRIGPDALDEGFFVRYELGPDNQVTAVWIIGPEERVSQLFNH